MLQPRNGPRRLSGIERGMQIDTTTLTFAPHPPNPRFMDLTGLRFNRHLVLGLHKKNGSSNGSWWCLCDCGAIRSVRGNKLRSGSTKSCGCFSRDAIRASVTKHGMSNSPEYHSWANIKARCLNPNNTHYSDYGGRGITVCNRWLESFDNFFADMGPIPGSKYSIERKDNDGNYCPENCKWATRLEQANNQRNNHKLLLRGEIKSLAAWARHFNIEYQRFHSRAVRGLCLDCCLSTRLRIDSCSHTKTERLEKVK